jgi:hypothetical protein
MLRWTNLNMLSQDAHGFKPDKPEAQGTVLEKFVREPNRESDAEKYGRHEEIRTPGLYRVKVHLFITNNNLNWHWVPPYPMQPRLARRFAG